MTTLASEEYYIIVPAQATNEVTNPSVETNTTGYTAVGAGVAIARSTTYQRRGLYSLEVTPASGVQSGCYFATVPETGGVDKTFSVDVLGVAGQAMRIGIYDTGGAALSVTTFTANGYWQRVTVTRTGTANTTRRLYVLRDSVASTAKFYVDGLYYSTINGTYLDGDMKGYVNGQIEYRWNGVPHASTSWRSGQTRSGGTMLRIKDYARIICTLGLGLAPVVNIAQEMAGDYSAYQTTRAGDREFVFRLAFSGVTEGEMQDDRQALINAVRPDLTMYKQPLLIRYQGLDASGGDASEPVDIPALYVDGLQDQPDKPGIERANLRFKSYLPFVQKSGDTAVTLGYNTTVANFAAIGYRDIDGIWKAMGTGATGGGVTEILPDAYGNVYVAGEFTQMGGVANTRGIAKWDGTQWSALGTGANGSVYALAIGPDGSLYAGGAFTLMGGVANTVRIAKWTGSAWVALGTGASNNTVFALTVGPDGTLYAGGDFALMGGVANTVKIAKWTGAAWSALSTGMGAGDAVYALAYGPDGLYAGGSFTAAGGVTVNNIAKWTGSAWVALSTGSDLQVNALAFGPDKTLYAGGLFSTIGGVTVTNMAKWNGSKWSEVSGGVNGQVNVLYYGPDGLYVGGRFTLAGGSVALPDYGALWANGHWMPLDIDVQDALAYYYAFAVDPAGRLYLGGLWTGTDGLSATVTASNAGGARAYPVVKFTGPGAMWQLRNFTTGKTISFKNLTLNAGEVATLDLRPGRVAFTSSFRGNLMPYILTGSDFDWYLLGGSNNVSAYMSGTTAASGIVMAWQDLYWSIDGAKR